MIVFDIETGPLDLPAIKQALPPFDETSVVHPGEFDESSVRYGNTKDADKRTEKLEAARKKHAADVANYETTIANSRNSHWSGIVEKAALSSVTGQVVAIGYLGKAERLHLAIGDVTEKMLLQQFWKQYKAARQSSRSMVGFNIKSFDVPFLAQRSWVNDVEVPASLLTPTGYLDSTFIDLMDRWKCGNRGWGEKGHGTLDAVCKACGLPGKSDDCTGDKFAEMLWSESESDIESAKLYLSTDLRITDALAERLGVQ